MAGTGKEGKEPKDSKEGKEKKTVKDDASGTTALLRRLADELAALRSDVESLKSAAVMASQTESDAAPTEKRKPKKTAAGSVSADDTDSDAWKTADDAAIARLGYAFSSVPKVSLVRALLDDGAQSAAQLGERAGLTTGSLYHHLRELTHAAIISSESRNQFALTDFGRTSAMALFAQAGRTE